jgi:acetyl esterase/lipase
MRPWPILILLLALCVPAGAAEAAGPRPNSGLPGAPCRPVPASDPAPAPDAGLDTFSLGPRAPAVYEIGGPINAEDKGRPAKRVMMFIHGGAWYVVGKRAMQAQRALARTWRAAGWETVSISYRGCRRSVGDVVRFYDLVRARVGPAVPICVLGQSAGGHLALMIATRRSGPACVISMAGPSDLVHVRRQGRDQARASGPAGLRQSTIWGVNVAKATFGRRNLRRASPIARASKIRARVLAATAADDILIPRRQDTALVKAIRKRRGAYAISYSLARGPELFVHGTATEKALAGFDQRVAAVVAPFGSAPAGSRAPAPLLPGLGFAFPATNSE